MSEPTFQLEHIQSANQTALELLKQSTKALLTQSDIELTIKGNITRLLWALNDGLDPSNAAAFVECASNIYQYATTTNEESLDNDSLSQFKRVISKQSLRLFLQRAREYDAETLRAILEKDRYGLFSGILLKDISILQTLQDKGLIYAREQLFAHLEKLETVSVPLPIHRKSIARLVAACQLKCIHKHQALGDYGTLALIRDFFGYHFSSSYNNVGTLNDKPHYLGRQPTIAMLARLAKNPEAPETPKKILLISIQAPHEGYGTNGKLKNFFHWFSRRSPVVTAENVPGNVKRLSLSVMDHSMGISSQNLTQFLQDAQKEVKSGNYGLVYTNCRGGKARSSGITALLKVYCNNTTLAAAFDEIKKGRNGAKRFEKLKSEQADVIIRTYFKSLIAEDADAQKRLTAFTSATPDVIAKHLKWYLENAQLDAVDGQPQQKESSDDFLQVMKELATDKTKFPQILKILLVDGDKKSSLDKVGVKQLMTVLGLNQSPSTTPPTDTVKTILNQLDTVISAELPQSHPRPQQPMSTTALMDRKLKITAAPDTAPFDEVRSAISTMATTGNAAAIKAYHLMSVSNISEVCKSKTLLNSVVFDEVMKYTSPDQQETNPILLKDQFNEIHKVSLSSANSSGLQVKDFKAANIEKLRLSFPEKKDTMITILPTPSVSPPASSKTPAPAPPASNTQ